MRHNRSEMVANLQLVAARGLSAPRIIRTASHAAQRVPSFANVAHTAARIAGGSFSLVILFAVIL